MALVLSNWYADVKANNNGAYIEIWARKPGSITWLFAILNIDPMTFMGVYYDKIIFQRISLNGYEKIVIPLSSVSSTYYRYRWPWKSAFIIFMIACGIAYAMSASWIILIGLVCAIVWFLLNKELCIGFSEVAHKNHGLVLKRSVIEGQEISESQFDYMTQIILALIDQQKTGNPEISSQ
ncbi:MAG: hypothetical protein ABL903_14320 [Methylococcales bacterium]